MHVRSRKSYVYFKTILFFFVLHYTKSPLRGISIDLRIVKPYTAGRAARARCYGSALLGRSGTRLMGSIRPIYNIWETVQKNVFNH